MSDLSYSAILSKLNTTPVCELDDTKKWDKSLLKHLGWRGIEGKGQYKIGFDNNAGHCNFVIIGKNGIKNIKSDVNDDYKNSGYRGATLKAEAELRSTSANKLTPYDLDTKISKSKVNILEPKLNTAQKKSGKLQNPKPENFPRNITVR